MSIIGNNGSKTVNGIIRIENTPAKMPSGKINITDKIIETRRKIIFIGILKIYNPAENNLNNSTNPNTIKRTENISIVFLFFISLLNSFLSGEDGKLKIYYY